MNIYLDNIIFSKSRNGGVSNYWFELTKYLLNQNDCDLHFFEDENAKLNFHRRLLSIQNQQIISQKSESIVSRLLPIKYATDEKLIYHSSYYRKLSGVKNQIEVTTVYDFIHSYYASFLNRKIHNLLKYDAIKRSKGVICISRNTYNDLQKFCPTKPNQKVEVIYVGVSDDYFPLKSESLESKQMLSHYKIQDDFILFIGGRTNYKNFDFVATVINQNSSLKLVIVGGGVLTEKELKLFSKEALQRITFISSVTNNELNILLNHANALLYPSSYEGFGIPVVEAMRAGCPVIGLNNFTVNEVASQSALLLNELNVGEFNLQLNNLKNEDFRSKVIESGFEESKKYSWEKCSKETLEFYKSLH